MTDSSWQLWLWVELCQEKNNYTQRLLRSLLSTTATTSSPPAVSEGSTLFPGRSFSPLLEEPPVSSPSCDGDAGPGQGHPRRAPAEDLTGPCPLCLAEDIPNPPGTYLGSDNEEEQEGKRRRGGKRGRQRERQIKKRTLGISTFNTWPYPEGECQWKCIQSFSWIDWINKKMDAG